MIPNVPETAQAVHRVVTCNTPWTSGETSGRDNVVINVRVRRAECNRSIDSDGGGVGDCLEFERGLDPSDPADDRARAVCDNGVDDDGDALIDLVDPAVGRHDTSERARRVRRRHRQRRQTADRCARPRCSGPTDTDERATIVVRVDGPGEVRVLDRNVCVDDCSVRGGRGRARSRGDGCRAASRRDARQRLRRG